MVRRGTRVDLATFDNVTVGSIVALRGYPGTRYRVEGKDESFIHLRSLPKMLPESAGCVSVLDKEQFDAMALRVVALGGD